MVPRKNYTLNIRVTDRGSPPLSSFGTLEIALLDENDNAPVFSLSSYRATVKENTAKGTTFFQVYRLISLLNSFIKVKFVRDTSRSPVLRIGRSHKVDVIFAVQNAII